MLSLRDVYITFIGLVKTIAALMLLLFIGSQYSVADTDVQTNNKQGKEMTPLMPELSCAKKARRIKKLDNKSKRRAFIKKCRDEREVRLKAEKEAAELAAEEKKLKEDKVYQDFLKKGEKRADKKINKK